MLSADTALEALAKGSATAKQLAERLRTSVAVVVPVLNQLRDEGRALRVVDPKGNPVARWVAA